VWIRAGIAVWKAGEAKLSLKGSVVLQRCVLSVSRRTHRGGGCGRDGGDPAGRLSEGCRSHRGGGRAGNSDGVHRHAPLPALKNPPHPLLILVVKTG